MEPTSIGSLRLQNRLVMLATHLSYCESGIVSTRLVDFYRERAKYSPGLIVIGGCYTEHLGMSSPTMIGISSEEHIPGLRRLVETIHNFDVPAAAQLYHAGRYAHSIVLGEKAVSASAVPCRLTRETPRVLTRSEIHKTVVNFGGAALRAKEAGFDAVEILGSAGYLLNQFLAPCTNKRTDEYGGEDLRSRARFPLEVVQSVRKAVGQDYPVIYRISGEDFIDDGLTLEDNKELVPWLVEAGIDCLNVTGGWHETRIPQITMDVPRGHYAYLAEALADVVEVPVIACNRINSPSIAENILKRGNAQLIGMSRGLIADPELPEKIRSGRSSEIRPCIACNQGCLDNVFMIEPVTCAINPHAGHETDKEQLSKSGGKIAVVGAGPAGLEVSRILAMRGFDVITFEKRNRPGGLLNLAARVPGRSEFAAYVSYLWREVRRLGVDLRLDTGFTVDNIEDEGFDRVVLATGRIPSVPEIDGVESPIVSTAVETIESLQDELDRAVVIGGDALGCFAALYLTGNAKEVEIYDQESKIGTDLGRTTRWVILQAMRERGVNIHTDSKITQVTNEYIMHSDSEGVALVEADLVVFSDPGRPDSRLYEKLDARGIPVDLVGTVERPMDLLEVVRRAYTFAENFEI